MKKIVPGDSIMATKADVKAKRPQTQRSIKSIIAPVAWVRRFSIEERLKVNNVELMPSTSLCSLEATLKTFHAMELVKKIIVQHLQGCSTTACWLGFLVGLLAITDVEISDRVETNYGRSSEILVFNITEVAVISLKSIISFLTILMCINVYLTYVSICKYEIARNRLPDSATVFNSNLLFYYLLESIVCLIHVPPLADLYLGIPYKLQLLVLVRVYVIARYMKEHNKITKNTTCQFLASVNGTEMSNMFLFKTFLKKMPFKVIVTTYLLNIFVGAYVIHVIEDNDSYLDSTWMVIVTMTTLGYGDVVPVTFLGRFLTGLMSVLGIFLMALLISVVHETLQLAQSEKRILAHLENAEYHFNKKAAAATLIQNSWRFYSFIKTNRESLAWNRIRKIAHLKRLKNGLYASLHNWRENKKLSGHNWYKEFINDDIAMMVTDVGRAVDQIQFTLNRLTATGRKNPWRKVLPIERTIYEEDEENSSPNRENVPTSLELNSVLTKEGHNWVPTGKQKPAQDKINLPSHNSPHSPSDDSPPTCTSSAEDSRRKIQQKLEFMEDYLDGFYTKAKTDLRDIKKHLQDELLGPNSNPDHPVAPTEPDKK